jgi:hypothetical protein
MSVALKGLERFDAKVSAWFRVVEKAATQAAAGLAKVAFRHIIENGPQYSGDFVANIKVGIGSVNYDFDSGVVPHERGHINLGGLEGVLDPGARGDRPAMNYARAYAALEWGRVKLGKSIFISSTAAHDEPYAWLIEDGKIKFRPENVGADQVFHRAHGHVKNLYGTIGKSELAALRRIGV